MRWIIDGMNVIGTRPDRWWEDRRRAMVALVERLDRWASARRDHVTVVFERPPSPAIPSSTIEVAYAPVAAANSADDEIVRLVNADTRRQEICVVTSDRTLIDRVRATGASVHPAHSFRDLIDPPTTNTARPVRELAVDFYRVSGVVLIVLGHWLAGCVTYHDGHFGRQNPLVDQPWTQWLTWPFQAVPVFFLVAGYAGAVSWTHRCEADGMSRQAWLRHRLARVLGPTAVYVGLVSVVVAILDICGAARSALDYAGWAVAMHLWFLAVYLLVVSLTPIAIAAQRRWGLLVPVALTIAVAMVDAFAVGGHVPYLAWLNYLLCWGMLYQLGIAWHAGLLAGRRPVLLAGGSAIVLALLIWPGPYPISMIDVPGQTVQNSSPPTVAMLAFASMQAGVAIAVAPKLNRLLRPGGVQRALHTANTNVMALYLWHMVPVIVVAVIGYPAGLLPQPVEGTTAWWLARLEWVVILCLLTAVEMVLLWWWRALFAAPLPMLGVPLSTRWAEPVTLGGAVMAAYGLGFFSAAGFAPTGRFPWLVALVFAAGVVLVAVGPVERRANVRPTSR